MPRATEPQIRQQPEPTSTGENLPYGGRTELEQGLQDAGAQTPEPGVAQGDLIPQPDQSQTAPDLGSPELGGDLGRFTNQDEELLFGPTDRGNEPITAGASFGPGPDAPDVFDENGDVIYRTAEALSGIAQAPPEVQAFLDRVRRGE